MDQKSLENEARQLSAEMAAVLEQNDRSLAAYQDMKKRVDDAVAGTTRIPLAEFQPLMDRIRRNQEILSMTARRAVEICRRLQEMGFASDDLVQQVERVKQQFNV